MGACFPQDECCILDATRLQWGEGAALPFSGTGRMFREPADQGSLRSSWVDGSEIASFLSRTFQVGRCGLDKVTES